MKQSAARCLSLPELNAEVYFFPDLRQPFPPHFHDALMLGCLLKGCREVEYADSWHLLRAGECEIVPAQAIHACNPVGIEASAWICIHFRNIQPALSAPFTFIDHTLWRIFESLAAFETSKFGALARAALQRLDSLCLPTCRASNPVPLIDSQMHINQNYAERIKLAVLAQSEKMDKFSFLRTFKSSTGITPYRYLEAIRVTKSQNLLRKGARLSDCAIESGFYDLSHFNRCFKARLGITPGAYREAYPAVRQ